MTSTTSTADTRRRDVRFGAAHALTSSTPVIIYFTTTTSTNNITDQNGDGNFGSFKARRLYYYSFIMNNTDDNNDDVHISFDNDDDDIINVNNNSNSNNIIMMNNLWDNGNDNIDIDEDYHDHYYNDNNLHDSSHHHQDNIIYIIQEDDDDNDNDDDDHHLQYENDVDVMMSSPQRQEYAGEDIAVVDDHDDDDSRCSSHNSNSSGSSSSSSYWSRKNNSNDLYDHNPQSSLPRQQQQQQQSQPQTRRWLSSSILQGAAGALIKRQPTTATTTTTNTSTNTNNNNNYPNTITTTITATATTTIVSETPATIATTTAIMTNDNTGDHNIQHHQQQCRRNSNQSRTSSTTSRRNSNSYNYNDYAARRRNSMNGSGGIINSNDYARPRNSNQNTSTNTQTSNNSSTPQQQQHSHRRNSNHSSNHDSCSRDNSNSYAMPQYYYPWQSQYYAAYYNNNGNASPNSNNNNNNMNSIKGIINNWYPKSLTSSSASLSNKRINTLKHQHGSTRSILTGQDDSHYNNNKIDNNNKKYDNDNHTNDNDSIITNDTTNNNQSSKYSLLRIILCKYLFLCFIIVVGMIVGFYTYKILQEQSEENATQKFDIYCNNIQDTLGHQVEQIFQANRELSRMITMMSYSNNETFPFVSMDRYESYAYTARMKGKFREFIYTPIVTQSDISNWLLYSSYHKNWIQQSYIIQQQLEPNKSKNNVIGNNTNDENNQTTSDMVFSMGTNTTSSLSSSYGKLHHFTNRMQSNNEYVLVEKDRCTSCSNSSTIEDDDDDIDSFDNNHPNIDDDRPNVPKNDYFTYPTLYTSPPPKTSDDRMIDPNNASSSNTIYQNIDVSSLPVYRETSLASRTLNDCVFSRFGTSFSITDSIYKPYIDTLDKSGKYNQVQSVVTQPVYEQLYSDNSNDVRGYIFSIIDWENILSTLLPDSIRGIDIVLSNTCDQHVTYALNGHDVTYMRLGDLHDTQHSQKMSRVIDFNENYVKSTLNLIQQVSFHCQILLHVYPNDIFINDNITNDSTPLIMTTIICVCFIIMIFVFCIFQKYVHYRNQKMKRITSNMQRFVESLFPSNVAHRLLQEAHQHNQEIQQSQKRQKILILNPSQQRTLPTIPFTSTLSTTTTTKHANDDEVVLNNGTADENKNKNNNNNKISSYLSGGGVHINSSSNSRGGIIMSRRRSSTISHHPSTSSSQSPPLHNDNHGNQLQHVNGDKNNNSFSSALGLGPQSLRGFLSGCETYLDDDCYDTGDDNNIDNNNDNNKADRNQQQQQPDNDKVIISKRTMKNRHHNNDENLSDFGVYKTKPIADLFPHTTVLFSDLVGFTAWSSAREPSQVFILLETIYGAFDKIARRRGVFKVETIGDCYVAVTGLPNPQPDHAVLMARFARDCMYQTWSVTKKLESTLGPDTGDLSMRMGLHSGQVTGGVLRGEKARFQLFGDTMNTAARIESTGMKSKIHLSQDTADLIIEAGNKNWIHRREDVVYAKGKGEMQTYWLELEHRVHSKTYHRSSSVTHNSHAMTSENMSNGCHQRSSLAEGPLSLDDNKMRKISWCVEVLKGLLIQIVERRMSIARHDGKRQQHERRKKQDKLQENPSELLYEREPGTMIIDEVKEIITLPLYDPRLDHFHQHHPASPIPSSYKETDDAHDVELDGKVFDQLKSFVTEIASLYRNNPFHNFEHASHVTMSSIKLLSRIIAPSDHYSEGVSPNKDDASSLHDHTYGITSDPLTQFSCVLSALIHDLEHTGVPNAQLIKEGDPLAIHYKNKSVAEQNSVDIAWDLLTSPNYNELRSAIYQTESEMKRFRQLVVNSVMATDIVDRDLKDLRNCRWEKAFSNEEENKLENPRDQINRKATIVIEHLIQASDVAHTMQHWHIYRKWNERFFMECYQAYKTGRSETDPSTNWYQGEIGFFDFYIIPLAKKLKNCGVFGVSSAEYLNYALNNRKEWEDRGQQIVGEMIEKVKQIWPDEEHHQVESTPITVQRRMSINGYSK